MLKLLKLRVENFATFDRAEINFEVLDYPVFIEGRTGAGKTTLFVDGITAALYGKAYGDNNPGSAKKAIMKGKPRSIVELEFEIEGEKYRIQRILYRDAPSESKLYKMDGNRIDYSLEISGTKKVDKFVEEKIGLRYDTLMHYGIVRQGEVYQFINMPAYKRRDLLIDLFKLGIFEKLKEIAKNKKRTKESDRDQKRGQLNELIRDVKEIPELEKRRNKLITDLAEVRKEIETLDSSLKNIEEKVRELESQLQVLSKELGREKELENQKKRIEDKLKELKQSVDEINELISKYDANLLRQIEKIREKYDSWIEFIREKDALAKEIHLLKRDLKHYEELKKTEEELRSMPNISEEIKIKENRMQELLTKKGGIEKMLGELEYHLSLLDKGMGRCPTCGAELSEERKEKRKQELVGEIERSKTELKDIVEDMKKIEKELRELRNKEKIYLQKKQNYDTLKKMLKEKLDEIQKLDEKELSLNQLETQIKEYANYFRSVLKEDNPVKIKNLIREMSNVAQKLGTYEVIMDQIKTLETELISIEQELSKMSVVKKTYEKLIKEHESLMQEQRRLRELRENKIAFKAKLEAQLKDVENKLKELREKQSRIKVLEKEIIELNKDIEALELLEKRVFHESALPTKLLEDYLEIISDYANDYLKQFGQDITVELKLSGDIKRQKIELFLYSEGYKREAVTFSGGESTLIGFAIRLAIGRLLSELYSPEIRPRFLVIDEGFGPLDEELRLRLAEALSNLMRYKEYEQIIIISHHRDLKIAPVFRTLLRVVKEEGKSRIVRI